METLVIEEVERVPPGPVIDLAWLCAHDHDLVTHHGHTLTGPEDARTWTTPDAA